MGLSLDLTQMVIKARPHKHENSSLNYLPYWPEHERKRLIRRTEAGQEAARARGRMGGRPKGLSPPYQEIAPMVINAYKELRSIRDIMKAFSIPSTTVYKILTDNNVPFQVYKKPTF